MDIEKFSKQVIETYRQNPTDRTRVVYTHASNAERDTKAQVSFSKAANVAERAISQYEGYQAKRLNHEASRDFAAKDIRDRFDRKANDLQKPPPATRPHGRSASAGL